VIRLSDFIKKDRGLRLGAAPATACRAVENDGFALDHNLKTMVESENLALVFSLTGTTF
jgi:hypothetical protein